MRKIIHIDMDAFYASVEQRDNPALRGIPLVVGGSPSGRGVVATASYEARKFGIRSAMSAYRAVQLCPQATFVRPRFEVYKEVSNHIREIFYRYTDLVEPLSLDEAYLDVTTDRLGIGSALDIAAQIKQAIWDELQLTASAGVSINKFVAKVASDLQKPNGLTFIGPSKIAAFMEALPVEKFHGVGPATAKKMKAMQLHTGADIKALTEDDLVKRFGKSGHFYYHIVRGIDNREVKPNRESKSVGAEDTFSADIGTLPELNAELDRIAGIVAERLERKGLKGKTVTLKIKYANFQQITRSQTIAHPIADAEAIATLARQLLADAELEGASIRLLGITLSGFREAVPLASPNGKNQLQLELF